jgi:hypothetical protein
MSAPLKLESIYYASPIPASAAALTMLGLVFDKVVFPGVEIPTDGFDPAEVAKEIKRLEELNSTLHSTAVLISMMKFIEHAKTLKGFCEFPGQVDGTAFDAVSGRLVGDLYDAIHGPRPANWQPIFEGTHYKGIPGSEQTLIYPGTYNYLAGALMEAGKTGRPLIVDRPGLPVPALDQAGAKDNAAALTTLLAIHCTALVLPKMAVMTPVQLMEFRSENEAQLRTFRRAMLRYAAELNNEIKDIPLSEMEGKTDFFVKTRILPELDELRETLAESSRTWRERLKDGMQILGDVVPACFTATPKAAIAAALLKNAPGFIGREIAAAGDKTAAKRRSDLYYLLNIERALK